MREILRSRWALVALACILLSGAVAFAALSGGDKGEKSGHEADRAGEEHGLKDARKEALFERRKRGGEGNREKGPTNPASEQVSERAYPRAYVDDRRALAVARAFRAVPRTLGRSAFDSGVDAQAAAAAAPDRAWRALGPTYPLVPKEATQFFEPQTQRGTPSTNSGRVTALAVDPACQAGACRMWVAAAGGGIWRTGAALATRPVWSPSSDGLPTNAFGSVVFDAAHNTLYAGSGEPNGSSDSEAGLGLFKSTDNGATWSLVPGSFPVAANRSISSIVIDPTNPQVIYIGTALARHGSSSVNGGRRTPPGAPTLGVYKSTDGGAHFALLSDLAAKAPADPTDPGTGADFFVGGINKIALDPRDHNALYAGVFGYGVWRSVNGAPFRQIFHTVNQSDFSDPSNPTGDAFGDRTEFDLVNLGTTTRAYLGDSSDDWSTDNDPTTPGAEVWRSDNVGAINGTLDGSDASNPGWTKLSNPTNGTPGFLAQDYCQNGQCGYDDFVASPPGQPNALWLGGSMNYDELVQYATAPPRSNGRGVIRSTNAGSAAPSVTWQDMTQDAQPFGVNGTREGMHPDMHAIAFAPGGNVAWVGSDGGVIKVDVTGPQNISGECDSRRYAYPDLSGNPGPEIPLKPEDLADCHRLLSAVPSKLTSDNPGLNTLQFQSLSTNPARPTREALGGTQDNGTFAFTGSSAWLETVGGDGGQSGFDANGAVRYHNYYDATPEVNFHGNDPTQWLDIYDVLAASNENQSFYAPFIADPRVAGRAFIGLQHVWRTDDHGGSEAALNAQGCNALHLDPNRDPCGDWARVGGDLTSNSFGDTRSGQFVVATERAESDTGTMWAATRTGRVFVAKNADATPGDVQYFRVDSATTPGRFVSGIAIDPNDPNHAFISYSGYNAYTPSTPGHLFEVRYDPAAHSARFVDRSSNLGDQPVTDVAYNGATGDVYASTDFGVLRLPTGSNSWVTAASGLPHVAVYGLTLSQDAHTLYAATHGRGAYQVNLPGRPAVSVSGPARAELGARVTFTARATSTESKPLSYLWGLPGRPSSARTPAVTFRTTDTGHKLVTLIVIDTNHAARVVRVPLLVVDSKRPHVSLRKLGRVRVGRRVTIRGSAVDPSGISVARISFGDGNAQRVRVGRGGAIRVTHRYRRARTVRIRLTAVDRSGHRATTSRKVRVRRR